VNPLAGFATGLAWVVAAASTHAQVIDSSAVVVLTTDYGEVAIEVDLARAPITSANFLHYVDNGLYDGGRFYRSVRTDNQPNDSIKISVIQGGINPARREAAVDPIRLEGTGETGLSHEDGTVSVARAGPDTGRGEFFICFGPQPELDEGGRRNPDGRGFAAFGRVVRGMDVARRIQALRTDGQRITPVVTILRAYRSSGPRGP